MDFPHLSDTKFPIIDNVNVYKYQNNFDYARWNGKVSFKLLNVLWNSNYADVPYFETDEERDEWFNEKDGYVGTLETLFNNTPTNTVKIPIPYNDAYKYNYIVVDMPMQTSEENPINFEDSNIRIKRWFYFIDDMTQFAPSTTELNISLDFWTTFINSVEIPYLMLERGHAPMMQTTVDEFLNNPIMNNEYLLADDFNYGNESIIQTSNYYPIGNGKKYVLFCAPYSREAFDMFDSVKYSGNATPPTYSNTSERWGYQIQVNNYQWKYGNTDYTNAQLPIYNMVQTGLLNGCECFAIEGSKAREFFNDCAHNCVHFIHGIQAMFILDESLFVKSLPFTFRGHTLYIADRKINNLDIKLNKEQFGFDSKYADIAKLYTFPYSSLEVTDDAGNSFTARVENCGDLKIHEEVSLIYPFLNYNVFLSGVNGNGEMKYIWKNIQDTDANQTIWADDFSKYMMNWDVPIYSIYVSSEFEYAANNFFANKAKRAVAIKDYENAVRYANTTRENTDDLTDVEVSNVQIQNAANTTKTNNDNNARTNITNRNITAANNNTDTQNTALQDSTDENNAKLDLDVSADIAYSATCYRIDANTATAITNTNAVAGVDVAGSSGILSAFTGNIAGGISGVVAAAIRGTASQTTNSIAIGGNLANVYEGALYAANKRSYARDNLSAITSIQKDANNDINDETCDCINDNTQTTNTNATNNTNAQNTADYNKIVALENVTDNNATYMRNATVTAEKANLVQKQLEAEYQYKNARLHAPVTYSKYSGDMFQDAYKRRGIRFNVRTQSKAAIAQTGDAFLRFGYALHRVWDMSQGFHYGKHFTFWKAEDIWINDGSGVANVATNTIGQILLKGVTVWKNPDEIGTVGIYNNI